MLIEHGMNGAPIFSDGRMLALYVEDGCSRSPGMLPVPAWAVIVAHSFTLAAQAASLAGTGMPGCALCTGIYICVCVCKRPLSGGRECAAVFSLVSWSSLRGATLRCVIAGRLDA